MRSKTTPFRATLRQRYSYLTLIAETENKKVKIRNVKGRSHILDVVSRGRAVRNKLNRLLRVLGL